MADSLPLKALFNPDGSVKTLAEFSVTDTIPVSNGGTGVSNLGSVVGGSGISVANGAGAVVKSFTISFDGSTLSFPGSSLTGVIDGGEYS